MSLGTCALAGALLAAGVALSVATPSFSATVEEYCAFISDTDKFASDGYALTDAASILRQDRANFHKFRLRDAGDTGDRVFTSPNARSRIPALLQRGNNDRRLLTAIVRQNIHVCVEVWPDFMVVYQR
jgi:hypothetical protein